MRLDVAPHFDNLRQGLLSVKRRHEAEMFSFVYRWRCCVVLRRIGDPFVHFPVSNWSLAPYVSGSEVPNVATFLLTRRLQLLQPQPAAVSLHVLWNATELSQQRQNPRQSNPFCRSTKSAEGLEPEVTASGETQLMHRCKCFTLTSPMLSFVAKRPKREVCSRRCSALYTSLFNRSDQNGHSLF